MRLWTLAAVMAVSLACGQNDRARTDNDGAIGTSGAGASTAESDLGIGDRGFIEDQLGDGDAEVQLGKLAQERGSSAEVREFGAMMVRDHTDAGTKLKQIAGKYNLRYDPADHDDHKDMHERLSKLSGAEFDRAYIDAMVNDHNEAVNEVEGKADSDNPDIKNWAAATLPTLKKHQERARAIQQTLENQGRSGDGQRTKGRNKGTGPDYR